MTSPDSIWQPHLAPGENLIWSAHVSEKLRRADRASIRRNSAILGAVSGILALLAAYRLYEAVALGPDQPDMSTGFAIPLYVAFGITLAICSVFMFLKLRLPPPRADAYAATSLRLIAIDAHGGLVDEIARDSIAGAVFDNDRRPTELHIIPRDGDARMFFIEHIDNLQAARARITDLLPEPTP